MKRSGKGRGCKGRGKGRFSFLAELTDDEYEEAFFGRGRKGRGKGKRSSGKGKGRRKNPIGSDGQIMRCGICNSDEHFRAQCPRGSGGNQGSFGGYASTFQIHEINEEEEGTGPLGDLLYPTFEVDVPTDTSVEIDIQHTSDESSLSLQDRRQAELHDLLQAEREGWRSTMEPSSAQWPSRPWPEIDDASAPQISDINAASSSHAQLPIPPQPRAPTSSATIPPDFVRTVESARNTWLGSAPRPLPLNENFNPLESVPHLASFRHVLTES